jgi:hypothetical protein
MTSTGLPIITTVEVEQHLDELEKLIANAARIRKGRSSESPDDGAATHEPRPRLSWWARPDADAVGPVASTRWD